MLHPTGAIAFIVVYAVESAFIIIGNAFAIFAFWTQKLHQKRTSFLLINLAVADFLVGVAEPAVLASEKIPTMLGPPMGLAKARSIKNPSSAVQLFATTSSVVFLALIALERMSAVLWPFRHRAMGTRIYVYSVAVVWVVGLCAGGLSLLPTYLEKVDRAYVRVPIHCCMFIALMVILASYLKIRSRIHSPPSEITSINIRSTEQNLRLSRTTFLVIGVSLVFWLPTFAMYSVKVFCSHCFPAPHVVRSVNVLRLANSMVNPLVYTFRMPAFKDTLKKLWCKRRQNCAIELVDTGRLAVSSEGYMTPQMQRIVLTSLDIPKTKSPSTLSNLIDRQAV